METLVLLSYHIFELMSLLTFTENGFGDFVEFTGSQLVFLLTLLVLLLTLLNENTLTFQCLFFRWVEDSLNNKKYRIRDVHSFLLTCSVDPQEIETTVPLG